MFTTKSTTAAKSGRILRELTQRGAIAAQPRCLPDLVSISSIAAPPQRDEASCGGGDEESRVVSEVRRDLARAARLPGRERDRSQGGRGGRAVRADADRRSPAALRASRASARHAASRG